MQASDRAFSPQHIGWFLIAVVKRGDTACVAIFDFHPAQIAWNFTIAHFKAGCSNIFTLESLARCFAAVASLDGLGLRQKSLPLHIDGDFDL